MTPTVTVSVEAQATLARLGAAAGETLIRAITEGFREALDYAAGAVVEAASKAGLGIRTGTLASAVRGWQKDSDESMAGFVGVDDESPAAKYSYLLTGEVKTITPVKGEYLAIPVEGGLTGAGVARFGSPRDVSGGKFMRGEAVELPWGGIFRGLSFGLVHGKEYDPLFVMLRSVRVQGPDVLEPTMTSQQPAMVETIQERVDAIVSEN